MRTEGGGQEGGKIRVGIRVGKELGFWNEEWGVVKIMENRGGRSGGGLHRMNGVV